MTRIRVLMKAIKLLEAGWLPYDFKGQARDNHNNIVAYTHPAACRFTATGAVVRAIFDLTGDPAAERESLWAGTMVVFKERYGGWTQMYTAFEKMNKEEVIDTFQKQLDTWNNA